MTPETAAPAPHARRWRGWLWLSLLANALLAWWLWRAQPPAPPPPATPVGESVLLRTPGGRLAAGAGGLPLASCGHAPLDRHPLPS